MKHIAGVELSLNRIRAITISRVRGLPVQTFELPWDSASPEAAVRVMQSQLGAVSSIGVAIGFEFLHPKHLKLPPVSSSEKRRIISLEPDRFFPVAFPLAVSATAENDLVFGMDASALERWIEALEAWAPVNSVEASPAAFSRAARALGMRDGLYEFSSGNGDRSYVEIVGGRLRSARRSGSQSRVDDALEVPESHGIPAGFIAAFGAARGAYADPEEMLAPERTREKIKRRRTASLFSSIGFGVVAVAFALFSASRARDRFRDRIDWEIADVRPHAAVAQALQGRIARLDVASAAASNARRAVAPLDVIAVLSRRLSKDVIVMSLHGNGDEWQITGTAKDAAAIIPALDADPGIENVRFLSGTSRYTEGSRTYETFSIGFSARPPA